MACLSRLNSSPPRGKHAIKSDCVHHRSLFCIFVPLVYGLLSRSLPLLAWTAVSEMNPPPRPFLTEVGRLLMCCSLSSSSLLLRPAGDLLHRLYWGHMNNLSFEFSPALTFWCLMHTGFDFNNIDSAPLLCASSDMVWERKTTVIRSTTCCIPCSPLFY